eukprot:1602175-Ditylum_brightwellii.AAC.1
MPNGINAFQWTVIFTEKLGNIPLLGVSDQITCSDGTTKLRIFTSEQITGMLPDLDGPQSGQVEIRAQDISDDMIRYTIGALKRATKYHVRVSAWNGIGFTYGSSQYSIPAIVSPTGIPDPPLSVMILPIDEKSLEISWSKGLSSGGADICQYKVEWDSTQGRNEVQVIKTSFKTASIPYSASADD